MKTATISKIFAVIFCSIIFASAIHAQEKPQALKFDEFTETAYQKVDFTDRANRFARYIKKDLSSTFWIVYYNPRKSKNGQDGKKAAEYAQGVLANDYGILQKQIVLINGGIRSNRSLEFWIVPPGADAPQPTPEYELNEAITCPEIKIEGKSFQYNKNEPLEFAVVTEGGESIYKPTYQWNVSVGKIIEGDGTSRIKVDVRETDAERIRVSIQVKEFALECDNQATAVTVIGMIPYKFAEIEYNYSYLAALLDGMFNELINDTTLKGYVIIYGRRVGNSKEVSRSVKTTMSYLAFRNIDVSRINVIDGGFREEGSVEIYLVPKEVGLPKPTPTVDKKFAVFTDKAKRKNSK